MERMMDELLEILPNSKSDGYSELTKFAIEAIAKEKDNIIMTDLMLEMLEINAKLNLQLHKQLEEIKRLSVTDQLTGLFNRRRLIELLEMEYTRMKRYGKFFSMIMFDIDKFKRVNDTFGHDVGDYVLVEVSSLIKKRLRASDVIARWGGEEFMILLPETFLNDAYNVAEELRLSLETYKFEVVGRITSSFGVAECNDSIDIDTLLKQVDISLYEAKESGRNCVKAYIDSKEAIE